MSERLKKKKERKNFLMGRGLSEGCILVKKVTNLYLSFNIRIAQYDSYIQDESKAFINWNCIIIFSNVLRCFCSDRVFHDLWTLLQEVIS